MSHTRRAPTYFLSRALAIGSFIAACIVVLLLTSGASPLTVFENEAVHAPAANWLDFIEPATLTEEDDTCF